MLVYQKVKHIDGFVWKMLSPNFMGFSSDSHECSQKNSHLGEYAPVSEVTKVRIRQMLGKQRLDRGFWGHNRDFDGQMWVNANSGLINHGLIRDVVPK